MSIVFVPNKGPQDYSDAQRFGELHFLTQGLIKRYATGTMYREIIAGMEDASRDDHLLVCSLPVLNAITASVMAYRFGRVNYLLFKDGRYIERVIDLEGDTYTEIDEFD